LRKGLHADGLVVAVVFFLVERQARQQQSQKGQGELGQFTFGALSKLSILTLCHFIALVQVKERVHSKDKQDLKQEISSGGELNSSSSSGSAKKSVSDSHDRLNNSATVDRKPQAPPPVVEPNELKLLKTAPVNVPASMFHSSSSGSNVESKEDSKGSASPPMKRVKCDSKNMVDVCVGTSVGTITEPDCLGPCEPGTSVTLEGIVWHETEGGVLAVNVTWRGKTYVGTLIDCTKHDWAPPRFCDSPTEDIESRMQKSGRSKRARNSTTSNHELINFTETRSSVSCANVLKNQTLMLFCHFF
jgi:hypothetical protein